MKFLLLFQILLSASSFFFLILYMLRFYYASQDFHNKIAINQLMLVTFCINQPMLVTFSEYTYMNNMMCEFQFIMVTLFEWEGCVMF